MHKLNFNEIRNDYMFTINSKFYSFIWSHSLVGTCFLFEGLLLARSLFSIISYTYSIKDWFWDCIDERTFSVLANHHHRRATFTRLLLNIGLRYFHVFLIWTVCFPSQAALFKSTIRLVGGLHWLIFIPLYP